MNQSTSLERDTDDPGASIVARTASSSLAGRRAVYEDQIGRLLDAGLDLMRTSTRSPTVTEIVAAAGVSREAFYRYFSSKDGLVAAIVEAGGRRLVSYLAHQMGKREGAEAQLRSWLAGVMAQAGNPEVAQTTRTVLLINGTVSGPPRAEMTAVFQALADLLLAPLEGLGSRDPARDAAAICACALGVMSRHLWQEEAPTAKDVDHLADFCLQAVQPRQQR
jgi:AcrR family transcriptional regulator